MLDSCFYALQGRGMSATLDSLRRHELPGLARFELGEGGLIRLAVETLSAEAHIYLQGAHVTHFQPANSEAVLFLSRESLWEQGKAIRGGVPICFPWFGPRTGFPGSPAHGFARTSEWGVAEVMVDAGGTVTAVLELTSDDATRQLWPHDWILRHRVSIGSRLAMTLEVENRSETPIEFEEALHTYLAVQDARQVAVSGLSGVEYLDKVDGLKRKVQNAEPITIVGETDRVYLNTATTCEVDDLPGAQRLRVSKTGSATTVVWNPWVAKAAAMADFADDEWLEMVCIETANAGENTITLESGGVHRMQSAIEVLR